MPLPRIITVDPSLSISRVLRTAIDLLERPIIQVDVPSSADALDELSRGCTLLVTAFEIDSSTKGFEFALQVKQRSPETAVLILGEGDDPEEMDEETAAESPFVYLCRPVDVHKLLRVLQAGIEGHDIKAALVAPSGGAARTSTDLGPVPPLSIEASQQIIDRLLIDLGAMAILLANRTGEVLLERGAVGYLNREKLASSLTPAALSGIEVKELVGGQMSTIQFFDGDDFDVFMLSVGLHHFLCAVFDGQIGSRQFGVVTRFGKRAVEDLIALIGANAFIVQPSVRSQEERKPSTKARGQKQAEPEEEIRLEPTRFDIEIPPAEPEHIHFDPIPVAEEDLAKLMAGGEDFGSGEDLFDFDNLDAEMTSQSGKGKLDWDQAMEIGILGKK